MRLVPTLGLGRGGDVSQCRARDSPEHMAAAKNRRGGWPTVRLTRAANALALAQPRAPAMWAIGLPRAAITSARTRNTC